MKFIKIKSKNLICFEGGDADGLLEAALLYKDQDGNSYPESDWEIGEATESDLRTMLTKQDENTDTYAMKRRRDYKFVIDQLDLIYWDKKNGTDNWEKHIDKVKSDYPKE